MSNSIFTKGQIAELFGSKMNSFTACASSANLGPGFDHLSVAVSSRHETLDLRISKKVGGPQISLVDSNGSPISNAPSVQILSTIVKDFDIRERIILRTHGDIPWSSGLGSSGAASVASVIAANERLGLGLTLEKMVSYSLIGEEFAAGAKHADNVLASLLGDLIVMTNLSPLRYQRFKLHSDLSIFLVIPSITIPSKTKLGRGMLDFPVSIAQASENASYLALLLQGLLKGDMELVKTGMNDVIVEPVRSKLFPFYFPLKNELTARCDLGVALSGGGPSVICIGPSDASVSTVYNAARRVFDPLGVNFTVDKTSPCTGGLNERRNVLS